MADLIQKTRELNIIHKGSYTISYDIDPKLFVDDITENFRSAELAKFQAGVMVTIGEDGYVKLADGAKDASAKAVVVPPAGFYMDNLPGIASQKLPALGLSVIETVQVVEGDIKPGTPLYVGTADKAGLLTKEKGTSTLFAGIALSANSAEDKTLVVELKI